MLTKLKVLFWKVLLSLQLSFMFGHFIRLLPHKETALKDKSKNGVLLPTDERADALTDLGYKSAAKLAGLPRS